MQKSRKSQPLSCTQALLVLLVVIGALMVIVMIAMTSAGQQYKDRRSRKIGLAAAGVNSTNVMLYQFTAENIERDPDLRAMMSKYLLNKKSLKSLKLISPGIRESTAISFFSTNPGWLSQRTFTADIFTCPPNSHEGLA